jgi:hypothetical protein
MPTFIAADSDGRYCGCERLSSADDEFALIAPARWPISTASSRE